MSEMTERYVYCVGRTVHSSQDKKGSGLGNSKISGEIKHLTFRCLFGPFKDSLN